MIGSKKDAVYSAQDHHTWATLFKQQKQILPGYVAPQIIEGMEVLEIREDSIPSFELINTILKEKSNFSVVPVKGLIPNDLFFQLLAERCFPSTCFIRKQDQLEYLVEPDVFHDVFGHVPLLAQPVFADFMQAFGKKGLEALDLGLYGYLAALYWFTVEFGLIDTSDGLRIYGAGIISSIGETPYAIDSGIPNRLIYDPKRMMKTQYKIDHFQKSYFVIQSYTQLFETLANIDLRAIKDELSNAPDIAEGIVNNPSEFYYSE